MLFARKKSLLKILVASVGVLGLFLTSCSDDGKSPESPITSVATDQPASPGGDGMGSGSMDPIYFAFDSSHLDDVAQGRLNSLADHLSKNKDLKVEIAGHCDERGTIEYNLALGDRRAHSVKKYLTNMGVDGSRITTISYGEERPALEGHDESAWSKNRRAEFAPR